MNCAVMVDKLSLDFPILGVSGRSLKKRLLSATTGGLISNDQSLVIVNALKNISFQLTEGDRLGLVGHNGAGKSTLLKVIAGIYESTSGNLVTKGKVVSTLNLSLGMEVEATGIENIFSRGLLLGMSIKEVREKIDEIMNFTELGEYLDMPVRIYSSGMLTRLAFATVTAMEADILLMDEVIGTGDASFIEKAERRLNSFMSRSKILVLASHSEHMIRNFCNKAILMEHGELKMIGAVNDVLDAYSAK